MPQTYSQFSNAPTSEKVVLLWVAAAQRLKVWTNHSGSVWRKDVPEFVTAIAQDGTALTQVSSLVAVNGAGKWFFDATVKRLYVWATGSVDPGTVFIRADYRMFFSNGPFDLPWDLDSGAEVSYEPLLMTTSEFTYEIDPDQFGVALEGQGQVALENTHGYFDSRFDKYVWENKDVTIWSWSPSIPLSEKQKIYRGLVASKAFSPYQVSFGLKDFIAKLSNNIGLEIFDGTEGDVQSNAIGSAKRRLYGRVKGLRLVGVDHVLDGYSLTGTVSAGSGQAVIAGAGTAFLDEVSPEDNLLVGENTYRVKSVDSNTQITLSSSLEELVTAASARIKPKIPWRKKNREWIVAGHAIKKISTQIAEVVQANRYRVDDPAEFYAGNVIYIDGEKAQIRRTSGDLLVLEQNLNGTPIIGDEVSRYPIQSCNQGTRDYQPVRDFEVINSPGECSILFDDLAEFNITRPSAVIGTCAFTATSRVVSGTGTQFLSEFRSRDWIRRSGGQWYEILSVDSDIQLTLRVVFAETTTSGTAERKDIQAMDDNAVVTVDCFGATTDGTEDGEWIKTGPQAVKDLLEEAGLSSDIDAASFIQGQAEAPQALSLKIPLEWGTKSIPSIKDGIDLINQSVMGTINFNSDFEIEFNVLDSKKPAALFALQDDDILEWEVVSRLDSVVKNVIVRYRHEDAERFSGQESSQIQERLNLLAARLSDTSATNVLDLYLYEESDAQDAAQRYAFYSETPASKVIIKAKLNLAQAQLGDKSYINLDRLYHRLGSDDSRLKMGIITRVSKDGLNAIIEVDDLSGLWNKVANFSEDTAADHSAAIADSRARNGYFTDDNGIVDDNDWTDRTNLIG
jgi:hypothetical protein